MAFNQSLAFAGLGVLTVNIPSTDLYNFQGTMTSDSHVSAAIPGPGGGAGTGTGGIAIISPLVMTVKQNGSTIFTSNASAQGFSLLGVSCTAGDVMTFQMSSSLNSDNRPNMVKLTLAVSEGLV